jgi:hypothetical protein
MAPNPGEQFGPPIVLLLVLVPRPGMMYRSTYKIRTLLLGLGSTDEGVETK